MATLVFWGFPGHGHVNPSLPIIAELVRRGERVYYYSLEEFQPAIESTGAEFRSYGEDFPLTARLAQMSSPAEKAYALALTIRWVFEQLLPEVRALQPDYVFHDAMAAWGGLSAQVLRVPSIGLQPSIAFNFRVILGFLPIFAAMFTQRSANREKKQAKPNYQKILDEISRTYHLKKMSMSTLFTQQSTLMLVCTSQLFQPHASSFDPRHYAFVGPMLQARSEAPAFPFEQLDEKRPLIYISLGTMIAHQADFFRMCLQAFAQSDWQIVIATGKSVLPEALGEIPANCLVQQYVPQLEILQRAALFVTHGGMNSVNEALAYDVPLVVIPQGADQPMVAKRVETLGAGKHLSAQGLSPEKLRRTVGEVLSQRVYAQAARRVGESLRAAGGSQKAADAIQALKRVQGIV
jgi:MGT family glycosyltransferase